MVGWAGFVWDGLYSLISEGGLSEGEVMGVGLNGAQLFTLTAI